MSLIEGFYKAYYSLQFALDLYNVIDKCTSTPEGLDQLTTFASPDPSRYKTPEEKERLLKLMGFEDMIPKKEKLIDEPFSPVKSMMKEVEAPFRVSVYSKPFVVSDPEEEPSASEIMAMTRELQLAAKYAKKSAYVKMQKAILAEAKGEVPKGTEERVLNVVSALKQYIRFI